ncbi:CcdC protein domain-containing protein [Cohnella terricola]|uniref:DUF1453 family protein n=1 Tax=Cohnella terricola TaxID=1289167 RepID=A0A559JBA0_9BACL|nr:CcdC protein domain-containing protein [Cohnella terricola]TVX97159.1 DUF1453 family protein [Cohnella terricola]
MDFSVYGIVILVAVLIIWRRTRGMYRPIQGSGFRLLRPLLFLVPCLFLIVNPKAHAPAWEWIAAIGIGGLLSLPLILTTNYERRADQQIYTVKSIGFFVSFICVLAVRFILRDYLSGIDQETMYSLFMTVLIGYVVPWRIASYLKFRKLYLSGPEQAV